MNLRDLALIGIGGACGACARYGAANAWPQRAEQFPTTTLVVNLTGAFVLGLLLEWLARTARTQSWMRLAVGVGAIGAFTTFSTFVTELVLLLQEGMHAIAVTYALVSVLGGILAVFAGLLCAGWRQPPIPDEGES